MSTESDDLRRQRIQAVSRDFFRAKTPGMTLEQSDLDAYYRRLQEAAQESPTTAETEETP
jgi:hypothetical protein